MSNAIASAHQIAYGILVAAKGEHAADELWNEWTPAERAEAASTAENFRPTLQRLAAEIGAWWRDARDYHCICGANEYCAADDCHGARGGITDHMESVLAAYTTDPLYCFTEGEAREVADEVLRLRGDVDELEAVLAAMTKTVDQMTVHRDRSRLRCEQLEDTLQTLSSPSERLRIDQARGLTHYIRDALLHGE